MKLTLNVFCQQAGPKVDGPGQVRLGCVQLIARPAENPGTFQGAQAVAGLTLNALKVDLANQFIPGGLYTVTVEEKPASSPV